MQNFQSLMLRKIASCSMPLFKILCVLGVDILTSKLNRGVYQRRMNGSLDQAYGACQPTWPKLMPDFLVQRKLFEINLTVIWLFYFAH